jgi:starch synthase
MGLNVLFVSVEVAPYAKVGGLADVAGSLPKALVAQGHDVRVLMPAYEMVMRSGPAEVVVPEFRFAMRPGKMANASLRQVEADGYRLWLLGGHPDFAQVTRSEAIYSPGRDAYLWLAKAALRACERADWIPDVVHAHDWHTGFLPVVVREQGGPKWEHTASCYTIHNLAYQGEFGPDTLDVLGLDHRLYNMDQLETFGAVNFLKAGCVFADQVNTVSPNYARQVQTEEYGCRLWGLMRYLAEAGRFRGILNGIDLEVFDPSRDPAIPARYTAGDLAGKAECRRALLAELGLPEIEGAPVAGIVSRLSDQKGFDLIVAAAESMIALPLQLVVLGHGDPWAATELRRLEAAHPDRIRLVERFDAPLAQRIYAGSDVFLMPSAFEPCGLGQLIAMRYGTIPVVRRTGGLADTVFEGENGFVFDDRTPEALFAATWRATTAWSDPIRRNELIARGMRGDYGWGRSAAEYASMYQDALDARRPPLTLVSAG